MKKVLKRSLSLLLAITIIIGSAYAGLSEVDFGGGFGVEAKASGTTFNDMLDRANALVNYEWKPSKRIYTYKYRSYKGKTYFEAGETVKGIPYTLFTEQFGVKSQCTLSDYKKVASSNYSATAACGSYGNCTAPVYGSCCASFVAEILGGSFVYSNGNPKAYTVSKIKQLGITTNNVLAEDIVAGDAVSDLNGGDHVIWVGEVTDSTITIYENTPPISQKVVLSKSKNVTSDGYLFYHGEVYSVVTKSPDITYTDTSVNLGEDFYGLILNYDYWKPITLDYDTDENVRLREETGSANQVWRFQRQDDGSYVISSSQNGNVLEFTNGKNEDSNIVSAHDEYWGGAYQKWLIFANEGGGYTIQSCHYESEGWYLTLDGNNSGNGTSITTCQATEDSSQVWSIYAGDEIQLQAPVLVVGENSSDGKTIFSWDRVYGSTSYDLKIWENEVDYDVEPYHTEWNVSSGFEIELPAGTYEAYICSNNALEYKGSDIVRFTVGENGNFPINLGEDFYGLILNYDYWKPITLDYDTDENVRLREETGSANQVWRFQRQDDGSYVISSGQTGNTLEFTNGKNENNNIVSAHDMFWGGAYQKWLVYANEGGGYTIKSCHYQSEGWYLTLDGNNSSDGTDIKTCEFTGGAEQIWAIYKGDDVQLKAPELVVTEESCNKTTFSWDRVYGSTSYDLKIWENEVNYDVEPYHTEWNVSSGFEMDLPVGIYEAYVCSNNAFKYKGSDVVKFTVTEKHDYSSEWTIDVAPDCTEDGSKSHHCTVCGEKSDITVIEATGHNYVVQSTEGKHPHTTVSECSFCGDNKTENLVSSTCIECNFEITPIDSYSYKLISYKGEETQVLIPSVYNERTVSAIENGCFKGNTKITSVEIADGVASIGSLAFMNCSSLEKVVIPASVTSIGTQAFYGFNGIIYCTSGSVAHEYAVSNNIRYVLDSDSDVQKPIQETENTEIDYENLIIRTNICASNDIVEILTLSESAVAVPVASHISGNVKFYGTGTVITVFDGNEYIGDFTLVVEGDTNGDSVVDALDAAQVALVSNGHQTIEGAYAMAADSNSDDEISIEDYQAIVNKVIS